MPTTSSRHRASRGASEHRRGSSLSLTSTTTRCRTPARGCAARNTPTQAMAGLRVAGLRVAGLRVAGLRVAGLRVAGLRVAGLRVAGLRVAGLRVAGLRVAGLRVAGLRVAGLRVAGLRVAGLRVAGLRVAGLRVAGLRVAGLRVAGLRVAGLRVAGLRVAGLRVAGLRVAVMGLAETPTVHMRRSPTPIWARPASMRHRLFRSSTMVSSRAPNARRRGSVPLRRCSVGCWRSGWCGPLTARIRPPRVCLGSSMWIPALGGHPTSSGSRTWGSLRRVLPVRICIARSRRSIERRCRSR